jgi:vancomycin resistance protein YoaR
VEEKKDLPREREDGEEISDMEAGADVPNEDKAAESASGQPKGYAHEPGEEGAEPAQAAENGDGRESEVTSQAKQSKEHASEAESDTGLAKAEEAAGRDMVTGTEETGEPVKSEKQAEGTNRPETTGREKEQTKEESAAETVNVERVVSVENGEEKPALDQSKWADGGDDKKGDVALSSSVKAEGQDGDLPSPEKMENTEEMEATREEVGREEEHAFITPGLKVKDTERQEENKLAERTAKSKEDDGIEAEQEGVAVSVAAAESKESAEESHSPSATGFSLMDRIRSTPRPKRILIVTLVSSMLVVGSIGFSYALEVRNKPASAPLAASVQEKPAKLILTLDGRKFELDLHSIGYNDKDLSSIDQMKLRKWLDQVKNQVYIAPKNAQMRRWGDPITPEEPGRKMDVRTVESWLKDLNSWINRPREIPMIPVQPTVTAEDLKKVNQKLIGDYRTKFEPGNVNRTTNIKLASSKINNLVLMPGEIFSFNKVVGPRTAERGYKMAHVIVKGEFVDGIGGGICQVSSTLFNSVDEAGLKIVAVQHHSKEVTYVPPGRDATVSWGGPDFRFKNNLNKPILIRVKISGSYITVYIYTVPGAKVHTKKVQAAPDPESFVSVPFNPPSGQQKPQQ